jgi:hypothetical protein
MPPPRAPSVRQVTSNARSSLALLRVLGALVACLPACAAREPIAVGACGNFVVEEGEDCDTQHVVNGLVCGSSSATAACRYTCAAGADQVRTPCPPGWGCGVDEICRAPWGAYVATDIRREGLSHRVELADVDGDGYADLVTLGDGDVQGLRTGIVATVGASGAVTDVATLPPAYGAMIADVTGDGLADVSVSTGRGIATLAGAARATPRLRGSPTLEFPAGALVRAMPVDAVASAPGAELALFVDVDGAPNLVGVVGLASETLLAPMPAGTLAGDVGVAQLDERPSSPCPELVFAYRGGTEVLVYSPCAPGPGKGWNVGAEPLRIAMEDDGHIDDHGVLVADLDMDGHQDLVVSTDRRLHVAYGNGDGSFRSHAVVAGYGPLNTASVLALPPVLSGETQLLAVADLDADGLPDFVVPSGIVVSAGGSYVYAVRQAGGRWSEALVADLRRDGRLGVVAAANTAVGVQIFTNAGGGHLNRSTILTEGLPRELTLGDFDGDLYPDVAFVEDDANATRQSFLVDVHVVYGRPSGAMEPGSELPAVDQATHLVAGRLAASEDTDAIDDLCLVSSSFEGLTDAVSVFAGNGDRTLIAPFVLRRPADGILARPLALASGAFTDAGSSVLALAAEHRDASSELAFRLWLQPLVFEAISARPVVVSAPLPPELAPHFGTQEPDGVLVAGALDTGAHASFVLVTPHVADPSTQGALLTGHVATTGDVERIVFDTPQRFPGRVTSDARLLLADFDGDDHPEALLVTGDEEVPGELLVFWNDGTGRLDGANPTHYAPPGDVVSDVTCVPIADSRACRPIVLGRRAAYALRGQPGSHVLDAALLTGVGGGVTIASGDVTGDGVFDLAIGDRTFVRIFKGVPVRK